MYKTWEIFAGTYYADILWSFLLPTLVKEWKEYRDHVWEVPRPPRCPPSPSDLVQSRRAMNEWVISMQRQVRCSKMHVWRTRPLRRKVFNMLFMHAWLLFLPQIAKWILLGGRGLQKPNVPCGTQRYRNVLIFHSFYHLLPPLDLHTEAALSLLLQALLPERY